MIISKLTSKAQTTIPQAVRNALNLKAGDEIVYAIDGDSVVITRRGRLGQDDPFGAFSEWHSDVDSQAYADL